MRWVWRVGNKLFGRESAVGAAGIKKSLSQKSIHECLVPFFVAPCERRKFVRAPFSSHALCCIINEV